MYNKYLTGRAVPKWFLLHGVKSDLTHDNTYVLYRNRFTLVPNIMREEGLGRIFCYKMQCFFICRRINNNM